MRRAILLLAITLIFVPSVFSFTIECDYSTGEQVCNEYRVKEECKEKDISVSYILSLANGYAWLNDEAKREYHEGIGCLTRGPKVPPPPIELVELHGTCRVVYTTAGSYYIFEDGISVRIEETQEE